MLQKALSQPGALSGKAKAERSGIRLPGNRALQLFNEVLYDSLNKYRRLNSLLKACRSNPQVDNMKGRRGENNRIPPYEYRLGEALVDNVCHWGRKSGVET